MWKLVTGEPYAGKSHVRFGGRGGAEPSLSLSLRRSFVAGVGLFVQWMAFGAFYTAGETLRAPRGTELAASCWFWLRMCFGGDAHAGASCRVQLGAPPAAQASLLRGGLVL